jgi:Ser/Thr protein kinase RdoA (MazF antagonist)
LARRLLNVYTIMMTRNKLTEILKTHYGINPFIIDKSAWGYNSIAYYVQDKNKKQYMAKTTNYSHENEIKAKRDVYFSTSLKGWLPTSTYLKNNEGNYILRIDGKILRVAHYIEGTAPFDMNMEVFEQVIHYLTVIHNIPIDSLDLEIPTLPIDDINNQRFLHGDLTASNIIVGDNKIRGVLDFEESCLGPVEYDLARSAVFCWFRMSKTKFTDVVKAMLDKYKGAVNKGLFMENSVRHAQNHLDKVIEHKGNYTDTVFWNDDYNFSKNALEEIRSSTI